MLPSRPHNNPLRIAVVTEFYYPHLGGICEHVHNFAREARRAGHSVDIITSNIKGATEDPGVIRIGRGQSIYFNGAQARIALGVGMKARMKAVLRKGVYDVVHVHSPLNPTLPLLAIDAATCPVVGTFHTYFGKSHLFAVARRPLQRRLDRMAAAIAVSPSTTKSLDRYFNAEWIVIPNGIDLDMFRPDAARPASMRPDVPVILFLGRLDPRNGLSILLDAFRMIQSGGREVQLVVVGDGPLRTYYERRARGNADVTFAGAVLDERSGYYANATVYACPTTKASFGITLLEAMACGTPIACSDIAGFRDVVSHGRQALMFRSGSARALADTLIRLLDDAALRRSLAAAGQETARGYSWKSVAASILSVYHSVASAH